MKMRVCLATFAAYPAPPAPRLLIASCASSLCDSGQVDPKPQLVLQVQRMPLPGCSAAQSLENGAGCGPEGEVHEEILTKGVGNAQRPSSDFDGESDILLVPRLVGAQGASSPQTSPSAQNGHAIGNGTSTGHGDEAGSGGSGRPGQGLQRLKPVEQLVVLAFGSAAVKSAPHDEMRGWEVAPFVEAICAQPLETVPFMLRSAAALQRVRWERGRLHTRQRALAAMAEVVAAQEEDPRHAGQGAKEDNTQGTAQGKGQEVEALFLERLPYALSVWFPLSCALSKEYGELLLSCGYVGEALGVFEEHQQWESVILCYTLLSKSSAASALIHSRLRLFPNDPRLWSVSTFCKKTPKKCTAAPTVAATSSNCTGAASWWQVVYKHTPALSGPENF